jgi:hypothetical protein
MTRVLGYTKKFIILKKDLSNMKDIKAKGHGKLEIKGLKGNLSISLENAEPDQYYNVLLIEGEKTYNLGKVYTEKNGKSKEELEFNISDLESRGLSLDKINGILIARDEKILLGEYIGRDNGSLERYIKLQSMPVEEEPQAQEESQEMEVEPGPELEPDPEPEYIIEAEPVFQYETEEFQVTPEIEAIEPDEVLESESLSQEELQDYQPDPEPEPEPQLDPEPDPEPESETTIEGQEIPAEDDFIAEYEPIGNLDPGFEPQAIEVEGQAEVKKKEYNNYYNMKVNQKNQTTKYILSILRYFPYVDPFRVNLSGYNWWRVDYQEDEKGFLPYFKYVMNAESTNQITSKDVTITKLMEVYDHYIFGLYSIGDEVKYYVYGIPGGFHIDQHPYGGKTGFNTWFEGSDIPGYWLLYIDPLTGQIMKPINPMLPID